MNHMKNGNGTKNENGTRRRIENFFLLILCTLMFLVAWFGLLNVADLVRRLALSE